MEKSAGWARLPGVVRTLVLMAKLYRDLDYRGKKQVVLSP